MGLLSHPDYGKSKWVEKLKKMQNPLCFLCYIGALIYFLMMAHQGLSFETHFSENALLPGLVRTEFNAEKAAKQFHRELEQELEDKYGGTSGMPVPWLVAKLSQLHLEVHTHNFTLHYPLGSGQVYHGTNVYGILRGARTASLEAIVISAPYRALGSHLKGTTAGIALMLAFAQFARPQKYWAKDIIFLFTEHEQLGMQAWLEAYHGLQHDTESFYSSLGPFWQPSTPGWDFVQRMKSIGWDSEYVKCLNAGTLKGRSGSIQAAINLEIHSPKIKYLEVKVEGLNGQLPNLDLVSLMHRLAPKAGVHSSFKYSYSWIQHRSKMEKWKNDLWTMLAMIASQIPGVPSGNHGLFHRYGIEAVTLEGREADDPAGTPPRAHALSPATFYRLGVHLESVVRSLNNLLERFHQSYFFYLMLATDRIVSISIYMPTLCLLIGAILLRCFGLWMSLTSDEEKKQKKLPETQKSEKQKHSDSEDDKNSDQTENLPDKILGSHKSEESTLRKRKASTSEPEVSFTPKKETVGNIVTDKGENVRIVSLGANYLLVHLLGYAVMNSPVLLTRIGTHLGLNPEVSVYRGLIAISVTVILISPFLPRMYAGRMNHKEVTVMNILVLIELAILCLTLGMLNFSLGLTMAALYTPLALIARVANNKKRSRLLVPACSLCLLLQPLMSLTAAMVLYSRLGFPEDSLLQTLGRGCDAATQAVMFAVVDSMIYSNWLFTAVTSALFPVWIIFWQILTNPVDSHIIIEPSIGSGH